MEMGGHYARARLRLVRRGNAQVVAVQWFQLNR